MLQGLAGELSEHQAVIAGEVVRALEAMQSGDGANGGLAVEVGAAARIAQGLMHLVQSDLLEQCRRANAEGFTTGLNDRRT